MILKLKNKPYSGKKQLIQHVSVVNPRGLGRRYSIHKLILVFKIRRRLPRRITEEMRLELSEALDSAGIGYEGLLDMSKKTTRLFLKPSK